MTSDRDLIHQDVQRRMARPITAAILATLRKQFSGLESVTTGAGLVEKLSAQSTWEFKDEAIAALIDLFKADEKNWELLFLLLAALFPIVDYQYRWRVGTRMDVGHGEGWQNVAWSTVFEAFTAALRGFAGARTKVALRISARIRKQMVRLGAPERGLARVKEHLADELIARPPMVPSPDDVEAEEPQGLFEIVRNPADVPEAPPADDEDTLEGKAWLEPYRLAGVIDERECEILLKRIVHGFSRTEIADELGLAVAHVDLLLKRARKRIREFRAADANGVVLDSDFGDDEEES